MNKYCLLFYVVLIVLIPCVVYKKNIPKIMIVIAPIIVYLLYNLILSSIRKNLRKIAIDTIDTFNKCEIDYWVDFGTLLGIIRDKDIIWGDNDVDISVIDCEDLHDKMKKAKHILEHKGYTVIKQTWGAYRVYKYIFGYELFADVYLNKVNKEENVYIGAEGDNSNIPINHIGNKSIVKWQGLDVKCPEKIHETLLWRYGEDYMTPKDDKGRLN